MSTVLLVGTLDTKGAEYAYVRERLRQRGVQTLVMDLGVLGEPPFAADVPGGLTALTDASGRWVFPITPPGVYSLVETQPSGFLDGHEQNADQNGPFTVVVGNDRFDNVALDSLPIRGLITDDCGWTLQHCAATMRFCSSPRNVPFAQWIISRR